MLLLQGESSSAAQNQKDNSLVHTQLQSLSPLLQCYQHLLPPAATVLPALQRRVQCRQLGNGNLEQSAMTPAAASILPPPRDKSHSQP